MIPKTNGNTVPAISAGPFIASTTGLTVTERDVPFEVWEAYGYGLMRVEGAIQWIIGDWLNYGEHKYGQAYTQALEMWPEARYQTLSNYKWVAWNVTSSLRREGLPYSHHVEVARLEPRAQKYWLEEAELHAWSVRELRAAIRQGPEEGEELAFSWMTQPCVLSWRSTRHQLAGYEAELLSDNRERTEALPIIQAMKQYHQERTEVLDTYLRSLPEWLE